ncbi:hypothetical protein F6J84_11280 [Microbacterium caowuchunii]|uniref:hypothetical protein n=1 Tax=Microbacterium caowuchunii TaxID=2614638 RepID=UPI0012456018|nr:hypothetical protein [Microbacterium caowuchunii]QEW00620.1 hypothetical protein F6J84_11280 [Microbacterium caowuchunii]
MSELRQDVERMLRWYPSRWRQQHGEAILGIYLDAADVRGDEAPLSRADRKALRAGGLFERSRYSLPIVAAFLGTVSIAAGMAMTTQRVEIWGPLLWLLVGPALLCLSIFGLRAAAQGGWTAATISATVTSAAAAFALMSTFWVGMLRDEVGLGVPPLSSLWALGLLYMAFVGLVLTITMAPLFTRSGVRQDWAFTIAFMSGFFGAIPLTLGLLSGVAAVLVGTGLVFYSIRVARRHRRGAKSVPTAEIA